MATSTTDEELRETLLELEQAGWESLRAATGSDFYGRTMTGDRTQLLAQSGLRGAQLRLIVPWTPRPYLTKPVAVGITRIAGPGGQPGNLPRPSA